MRKLSICLVVVMSFAALAAGCAASGDIELTQKDSGSTVQMALGQRLVVELPSNPSTGYTWVADAPEALKQEGENEYVPDSSASGVVGAGGVERLTFVAASAGSGRLLLEYRRPWETTASADKTWEAEVGVK